jgi:hypothetical protein
MSSNIERGCYYSVMEKYKKQLDEINRQEEQIRRDGKRPLHFNKARLQAQMANEVAECKARRNLTFYGTSAGLLVLAAAWKTYRVVQKEQEEKRKAQQDDL